MQRYFIELSYDGGAYHGWQRQPNASSIQQKIEEQIAKLHSNTLYPVVGCGRTDTGVHAHHYVLHVDLPEIENPEHFCFKLNRMLPDDIAIHRAWAVDHKQHARFSASARTYRYFVHRKKDPFLRNRSWYVPEVFDMDQMNEAAMCLLGTQDFTSLSKLHTDVKTNICTVERAFWTKDGSDTFYFEICADRFLRNMVRATVGTLMDVGTGRLTVEDVSKIINAKDRGKASTSVPGHGLFLWNIDY